MKYLLVGLMAILILTNCKDDDDQFGCIEVGEVGYEDIDQDGIGDDCDFRDDRDIQERIDLYLIEQGLTAESTASGLHYIIDEPGTGDDFPELSSEVTVHYHGTLENGFVFDTTDGRGPATFFLTQVILGWQEGIPLFKKGGKGKLIIPPSLAYGESGNQGIPSNAILIFDIELVDF